MLVALQGGNAPKVGLAANVAAGFAGSGRTCPVATALGGAFGRLRIGAPAGGYAGAARMPHSRLSTV